MGCTVVFIKDGANPTPLGADNQKPGSFSAAPLDSFRDLIKWGRIHDNLPFASAAGYLGCEGALFIL